LFSLRFTQSTDEFFFTASNQIVNDLREPLQTTYYLKRLQASKLAPASASAKNADGKTPEEI